MVVHFYLELIKLKRRSFFLALIALLVISIIWSSIISLKGLNRLQSPLMPIYDLSIINTMIMPLFISILSSRLMELEHSGKTFKLLQTNNESSWQLFKAKYLFMTVICSATSFIQVTYLYIFSNQNNLATPIYYFITYIISFITVSVFLSLIHLFLAFKYSNQSITIISGLVGSFVALVTGGMLPKLVTIFIPWQYYILASPINRLMKNSTYIFQVDQYFNIKIILLIIFTILSIIIIKKEIKKENHI
ncbi:ABC transporter permease [Streptococcus uberis]|uniref:ABC transporter permease n=1 Tax=Streptococcus uberis TaxID=1349 RepID=UPI00062039C6|nr:ABC transporter permease [Streptococcus uberis]KKF41178.1 lantibiotic ABC transporter permease [Streptococcus uberis EF20/0145]MTB58623.1 ABC transporter permease [Streptococcus uberis]